MVYNVQKNDSTYFYEVTYNEEELNEILEELQEYRYTTTGRMQLKGEIETFPVTKSKIQTKVRSNFYKMKGSPNDIIYDETIHSRLDRDSGSIICDYSYSKVPDLYHFINIILKNKCVFDHPGLFGDDRGNIKIYYAFYNHDQMVLDKLFNYVDSEELVEPKSDYKAYDYKKLNELYKRTLENLTFHLIAVKKPVVVKESIDGLAFQKKKNKIV